MGELTRNYDWSQTLINSPDQWPQSLRTTISIILNSKFPMFLFWGEDLICFYNDAYRPSLGNEGKHPWALGKKGEEVWPETWQIIKPLIDQVLTGGEATWSEDQLIPIYRNKKFEDVYWTFSYSPVIDENGKAAGVFVTCEETTQKVGNYKRLEAAKEQFQKLVMQAPVAIAVFRGNDFVAEIVNDAYLPLVGKTREAFVGKPLFQTLPETKEVLEPLVRELIQTGKPFPAKEFEIIINRNGKEEICYFDSVWEPFYEDNGRIDGFIVVAHEVTDQVLIRKKIEDNEALLQQKVLERTADLEKQKSLLDNILKHSSNGISVTEMIRDENGKIVDASTIMANEAAVKFTGLPLDIYLTKTAVELDPDILESHYGQMCMKTLETGEPSLIQYFLQYTQRWLELTVSKMDDDHLIHIFTDVTPIKEAQLQLEKTVEELRRSNTNLEEFAYAASHDLKEPIRKIHFFSDRLKNSLNDRITEEEKRSFERMEIASKRMNSLIEDLLTYSRISLLPKKFESVNLNQLINLVLNDLDLEIEEKGAKVTVNKLFTIRGYHRQLQQAFQNILSNSLKYSKPGASPDIEITCEKVQGKETKLNLSMEEQQKEYYVISINDNGIGFEQTDAERIFNVFTRLHGNTEYKGTGVGLSIVKKIIENHNGYVTAESEPGKGATFKIYLPTN